jgi:hypothetical protein
MNNHLIPGETHLLEISQNSGMHPLGLSHQYMKRNAKDWPFGFKMTKMLTFGQP